MAEVFTGARAKFYINGQAIGYCAGVSGEEAIDYEPVETLDFLEVREHIPVSYRASLSAAFFRLVGSSLKEYLGRQNNLGGMEIFPKFDNILTSGVLSAAIHNTKTVANEGEVAGAIPDIIAKFTSVRAASKTFDVSARGVVTENCSFVAIKQMDESELNA
tara:strand:- start:516 stop:998 length:483 start_codon:yes stop_codon:yes gene_type:complete